MRKTGWLFHYAFWYGTGGLVALVLSQLPGLELRVHHYILATMILPCTAFPTRLSAIYQGFFLGMFLNGVAAFDFDSILQTSAEVSLIVRPLNALTHCIAATTRCARRNSFTHILDQLEHMECIDSIYQPVHLLERHSSCGQ